MRVASGMHLLSPRPTLRAHICPSYRITELFGVQKWGSAQLYKAEGLDFTAVMALLREYLLIAGICVGWQVLSFLMRSDRRVYLRRMLCWLDH